MYLPPSATQIIARCTVPGCGKVFYRGEQEHFQKHVGKCARANMDRIRATIERQGAGPLNEDFDPEVTRHMRKVGERMLAEGRLQVKSNERAGFS